MSSAHPSRDIGAHALRYAVEFGWPVLLLRDGAKIPATRQGVKDGTTDPDVIHRWWRAHPTGNVGIACGGGACLLVIDIENATARDALTARYGTRPPTPTAATPRGGWHEFFTTPPGMVFANTVKMLVDDVDTRAANGYVVAPPSRLADGRGYRWMDGLAPWDLERAPLPPLLLEALHPAAPRPVPVPALSRPASAFDPVETLDALRYLDADDYTTWRDVGLALKASGDPSARGVWDAWSAGSAKYAPAVQAYQWDKMQPTDLTVASIFYHARAAGWRPIRRAA